MTENKLICPFCQQELKNISKMWFCQNENCKAAVWTMEETAWQELIRTRKALDIAVDALKELRPTEKKSCYLVPTVSTTQRIIDEALEQINNKE